MSKLYNAQSNRSQAQRKSRGRGRRFYSSLDMSIIKHDIATKNSEIKRGDSPDLPNQDIIHCGCGATGCFLHIGRNNDDSQRKVYL